MKKLLLVLLISGIAGSPETFGQAKSGTSKLRAKKIDTLLVHVDHLTLKELVDTGKFAFVDESITEQFFPVQITGRPTEVTVYLIYFGQTLTSESIIDKMLKAGLYPGTNEHLLAVGAEYPDLQKQFAIAALGSKGPDNMVPLLEYDTGDKEKDVEEKIAQKKHKEIVIAVDKEADKRDVILVEWEGSWKPDTRYIALNFYPPKSFFTETVK